ncbi:hypothetical protein ACFQ2M_25250 [Kitasatospora saccharophila]|uniref:hypothetical protein n=1 Tax=Kitasatospora saccharophila TaxID=407973 RepID=UPI00363A6A59
MLAHRLSTIRAADRVVVIREGRIVQQGPPAELAEQDGPYRELLREAAAAGTGGDPETAETAETAGTTQVTQATQATQAAQTTQTTHDQPVRTEEQA